MAGIIKAPTRSGSWPGLPRRTGNYIFRRRMQTKIDTLAARQEKYYPDKRQKGPESTSK